MTFKCQKPPTNKRLSGPEKGKLNKQNLLDYIKHLKKTGQKFPENQFGDVNESYVAEQCGFRRTVFSATSSMGDVLKNAVLTIGTETIDGKDPYERSNDEAKQLKKQLNDAKRDLAIIEEKNAALEKQLSQKRKEIKRLTKKTNEDAESLEFMLETGRRFTL
jgi:predicted RNase H-like nuclease (RuvC/YqgF family)